MLPDEDRRSLLELARRAAEAAARGTPAPDLTRPSGALREKGAAFVSLRVDGQLHGCVGHIQAVDPLWICVRDMAQAAANDERFPPLTEEKLYRLTAEISILSPLFPLKPEEIEVGTHGLCVRLGRRAGLLLPQVAVEWGWEPRQFLRRTYEKAGLNFDEPDAELFGFTVEKLSET